MAESSVAERVEATAKANKLYKTFAPFDKLRDRPSSDLETILRQAQEPPRPIGTHVGGE